MRNLEITNNEVEYIMIGKSFTVVISEFDGNTDRLDRTTEPTEIKVYKVWNYDSEREFEVYTDWSIDSEHQKLFDRLPDKRKKRLIETIDNIKANDEIVIRLANSSKICYTTD